MGDCKIAFFVILLIAALVFTAPQEEGKYTHDSTGDTSLPYKHDTTGDEAEPYIHDSRGDSAEPYKHDPAGDNAEPYVKDYNGWGSEKKDADTKKKKSIIW